MSTQEFDQMDEELMGMVNDHAAPAAVADAEEIVERVTAPKTESAAEKLEPNDYLQDTGDGYRISKDQFNKLEREVEAKARNKTLLAVILSLVIAAALILVLAVPALRFWLVALGVISCAVVAGIAIDRWCRR